MSLVEANVATDCEQPFDEYEPPPSPFEVVDEEPPRKRKRRFRLLIPISLETANQYIGWSSVVGTFSLIISLIFLAWVWQMHKVALIVPDEPPLKVNGFYGSRLWDAYNQTICTVVTSQTRSNAVDWIQSHLGTIRVRQDGTDCYLSKQYRPYRYIGYCFAFLFAVSVFVFLYGMKFRRYHHWKLTNS